MNSLKIICHLSQEYFDIFKEESILLFETFGFNKITGVTVEKPLLILDLKNSSLKYLTKILRLAHRSSSIKRILIPYWHGNIDDLYKGNFDIDISKVIDLGITINSFAIHIHNYSNMHIDRDRLIDEMYNKISNVSDVTVDLNNPDIILALYILGRNKNYLGIEYHTGRKGYAQRRPSKKPVFTPFSLDPKLSRLLINLSGVPDNGLIIDPFCGVAGIPYEASLIGINSICIELKWKWASGAMINLKNLLKNSYVDIICGDSLSGFFNIREFYVATDPPYGRITSLSDNVYKLYQGFIESYISRAKGSAFFSPFPLEKEIDKYDVNLIKSFKIAVHKNLTRYLYVIRGT